MRHARASCKSNKDMIAKQWQEFELRFPRWGCADEIIETDAQDLDSSEPTAGALGAVLAVYFADQGVAGSSECVVTGMRVSDQQQFVMRWL